MCEKIPNIRISLDFVPIDFLDVILMRLSNSASAEEKGRKVDTNGMCRISSAKVIELLQQNHSESYIYFYATASSYMTSSHSFLSFSAEPFQACRKCSFQ